MTTTPARFAAPSHPDGAQRRSLATLASFLAAGALAVLGLAPLPAAAWGSGITGSGKAASESRSVADFQAVTAEGSIDIVVRQGTSTALKLQADDNLLPLMETVVQTVDGAATLTVRWKAGQNISSRTRPLVEVTTPRLSAISSRGSGDLRLEPFKTPALKIALAGSGDLAFTQLATEDLAIQVAGSSDIMGSGRAARLNLSISGSGDAQLSELASDDVSVRIAGSGDASVQAHQRLTVSIAGSGDVTYRGEAVVTSAVAGSGRVSRR